MNDQVRRIHLKIRIRRLTSADVKKIGNRHNVRFSEQRDLNVTREWVIGTRDRHQGMKNVSKKMPENDDSFLQITSGQNNEQSNTLVPHYMTFQNFRSSKSVYFWGSKLYRGRARLQEKQRHCVCAKQRGKKDFQFQLNTGIFENKKYSFRR